ncbi:hypothetical protein GZ77_14525 [Endozoicomonas montiporae]|uniref:Uncharacterized protein n=2 Tax=Endozoicomonas montiporae TaxID=1027273 RepID=A0A081N518_9GAMM|nr:hypothetical protein [Endozoicomonas montiporae]AMO57584.1 hypothetical protein EZMO1_3605 [Endozoicomonas montiporae CL-33]KEQ13541.1 hypothetical protein GZ77_14525 [Endozoicomonas montiporae]
MNRQLNILIIVFITVSHKVIALDEISSAGLLSYFTVNHLKPGLTLEIHDSLLSSRSSISLFYRGSINAPVATGYLTYSKLGKRFPE